VEISKGEGNYRIFFDGPLNGIKTNKRKLYAIFEILYTMVDFFCCGFIYYWLNHVSLSKIDA